jgi:predicted transcriptional regulator
VVLKANRRFNGKSDRIITPGHPATDIYQTEKVFFVVKDGVIYRNDRSRGKGGATDSHGGGL